MNAIKDVAVVGGGHNGLACAAYLAKAGLDVVVLERREVLGGAGRDRGALARLPDLQRVSAENAVTSRDLRILVEEAAEPVASEDTDVIVGDRGVGPAIGWSLAEGPVRPVAVVVIDVFAEGAVEMSPAGNEDAVGALAPACAQSTSTSASTRWCACTARAANGAPARSGSRQRTC